MGVSKKIKIKIGYHDVDENMWRVSRVNELCLITNQPRH